MAVALSYFSCATALKISGCKFSFSNALMVNPWLYYAYYRKIAILFVCALGSGGFMEVYALVEFTSGEVEPEKILNFLSFYFSKC